MRWGHAPSPLHGWGYPHPLAGESGANDPSDRCADRRDRRRRTGRHLAQGRRGAARHRDRRVRLSQSHIRRVVLGAARGPLRRARPRGLGGGRRGGRGAGRPAGGGAGDCGPARRAARRRTGRCSRARRRRVRCRRVGRAGQTGRGGGRRAGSRRVDDRRDHRLVGQDIDERPAGRGARTARRGGGTARVVQQRAGPPVDRPARHRQHRLFDPGALGAPSGQHRRAGSDRAAGDRGGAQRRDRAFG